MDKDFNELIELINNYLRNLEEQFSSHNKFENSLANFLITKRTDWKWRTNRRLTTNALPTIQGTIYDIFGGKDRKAFIIQLKNEICSNNGVPQDPPNFPYAVLKDCVKIEIGMRANFEDFDIINGISIGITSYVNYWSGDNIPGEWGENYILKIKQGNLEENKHQVTGIIRTITNPKNEFTRIYHEKNKRCHISLGLTWNGEWRDTKVENYRYLILTTTDRNPKYQHNPESSDTIPFMSLEAKENYSIIRELGYIPHLAE